MHNNKHRLSSSGMPTAETPGCSVGTLSDPWGPSPAKHGRDSLTSVKGRQRLRRNGGSGDNLAMETNDYREPSNQATSFSLMSKGRLLKEVARALTQHCHRGSGGKVDRKRKDN